MRTTITLLTAAILPILAAPAYASSDDAWEAFRQEVKEACSAIVTEQGAGKGEVDIDVNPFGSQSYGAALVTVKADTGSDRMVCVFDKETREAELTAPF